MLTLFLSLLLSLSSQTPAHPDFSGHWVWDAARTRALTNTEPATPLGPVEWTITQTADTLTMVRPWNIGPDHHFVYKMDGSDSENTIASTVHHARLKWVGDKIVLAGTSVTVIGDASASGDETQTIWLTSQDTLVVERTIRMNALSPSMPPRASTMVQGFRRVKP